MIHDSIWRMWACLSTEFPSFPQNLLIESKQTCPLINLRSFWGATVYPHLETHPNRTSSANGACPVAIWTTKEYELIDVNIVDWQNTSAPHRVGHYTPIKQSISRDFTWWKQLTMWVVEFRYIKSIWSTNKHAYSSSEWMFDHYPN